MSASSTWRRLQLLGRRWPALYRRAHAVAMVLLPVELLTGAALYFPRLHTLLMRQLPLIEAVHAWCGLAFGVLLLLPVAVPVGRRLLAVLDWNALFWGVGGLTLTGLALWLGWDEWALLRAGAFTLHGLLAVGLLLWAAYHAGWRWLTARRAGAAPRVGERRPLTRRQLALQLERSLLASFFGSVLVGLLFDVSDTAAARATPAAADSAGTAPPLPGFELYTVTGSYPSYDPRTYALVVDGAVAHPLRLSLQELLTRLPQVTETRNFRCVTGWEVPDVLWQGIRIADVLALAQPLPGAGWLTFHSFDGVYTDSLSMAQALASGVLLAHHADGRPLAQAQGAPLRLVVPQMYGYKSVKWLGRIELARTEALGYWEQRGYGPNAYIGTVDGWPPGQGPHFW
jgi:DMSO/TMAO reductase YedYZ molybdopterin-dependent catalytic subunit